MKRCVISIIVMGSFKVSTTILSFSSAGAKCNNALLRYCTHVEGVISSLFCLFTRYCFRAITSKLRRFKTVQCNNALLRYCAKKKCSEQSYFFTDKWRITSAAPINPNNAGM